jgi:hypothetical protein
LQGSGRYSESAGGKPLGGELEGTMLGMVILSFLDIFWWLRR